MRASSADIDQRAFQALDLLLARYLGVGEIDLPELVRLISRNPVEAGPLRELGEGSGEEDLEQRLEILWRAYPAIKRHKEELRIGASLLPETFEIYIPIARFMARRSEELRRTYGRAALFGINGGQGSGKTTINQFLQAVLSLGLGKRVAGLSIDDLYKSHAQRQEMGRSVHPLFTVRSVAGTHDTELAMATLRQLMEGDPGTRTRIPRFDKMAKGGEGDRLPESHWPEVEGPLDMVILEGWCVGACAQRPEELLEPVNLREAQEDPDGVWRARLNRHLATDYRRLFELIDELLVIQVPGMEQIYRNRELQEQHLRRKLEQARSRGEDTGEQGAMTPEQVVSFISLVHNVTTSIQFQNHILFRKGSFCNRVCNRSHSRAFSSCQGNSSTFLWVSSLCSK